MLVTCFARCETKNFRSAHLILFSDCHCNETFISFSSFPPLFDVNDFKFVSKWQNKNHSNTCPEKSTHPPPPTTHSITHQNNALQHPPHIPLPQHMHIHIHTLELCTCHWHRTTHFDPNVDNFAVAKISPNSNDDRYMYMGMIVPCAHLILRSTPQMHVINQIRSRRLKTPPPPPPLHTRTNTHTHTCKHTQTHDHLLPTKVNRKLRPGEVLEEKKVTFFHNTNTTHFKHNYKHAPNTHLNTHTHTPTHPLNINIHTPTQTYTYTYTHSNAHSIALLSNNIKYTVLLFSICSSPFSLFAAINFLLSLNKHNHFFVISCTSDSKSSSYLLFFSLSFSLSPIYYLYFLLSIEQVFEWFV